MSAKHTPGPWFAVEAKEDPIRNGIVRAGPLRKYANGSTREQLVAVYSVTLSDTETSEEQSARKTADARLIAAAPDLFDALEFGLASQVDCSRCWVGGLCLGHAAIAKARGEP